MSKSNLPQKITAKKIRFKGTETFINAATGEIQEMAVTSIEERDFNFTKVWMRNFIQSLEIIGNKKTKVAYWIIDHINKENQISLSYREIAKASGASYQTVATTMKALQDGNFLRKVGTAYMVNPDIVFKGTKNARFMMATQYHDAPIPEPSQEEVIKLLERSIDGLQKRLTKLKAEAKTIEGTVNGQLEFNDNGDIYERVVIEN